MSQFAIRCYSSSVPCPFSVFICDLDSRLVKRFICALQGDPVAYFSCPTISVGDHGAAASNATTILPLLRFVRIPQICVTAVGLPQLSWRPRRSGASPFRPTLRIRSTPAETGIERGDCCMRGRELWGNKWQSSRWSRRHQGSRSYWSALAGH